MWPTTFKETEVNMVRFIARHDHFDSKNHASQVSEPQVIYYCV